MTNHKCEPDKILGYKGQIYTCDTCKLTWTWSDYGLGYQWYMETLLMKKDRERRERLGNLNSRKKHM